MSRPIFAILLNKQLVMIFTSANIINYRQVFNRILLNSEDVYYFQCKLLDDTIKYIKRIVRMDLAYFPKCYPKGERCRLPKSHRANAYWKNKRAWRFNPAGHLEQNVMLSQTICKMCTGIYPIAKTPITNLLAIQVHVYKPKW